MKYALIFLIGISPMLVIGQVYNEDNEVPYYESLDEGTITAEGNIGFNSWSLDRQDEDVEDESQFEVEARGLYNISPRWGFGLDVGYQTHTQTSFDPVGNEQSTTRNIFSVGPIARLSLKPCGRGQVQPFVQFHSRFGFGSQTTDLEGQPSSNESDISSFDIGLGAGINYWVSRHVSLGLRTGVLNYSQQTTTTEVEGGDDNEEVNSMFSTVLQSKDLSVGVCYYIPAGTGGQETTN